jgi:nucleoside phosphorylase/CheY-like chemotaxis protein
MKILIVDDDLIKTQHIINSLSKIDGFDLSFITYETNAHSAKLKLEQISFDLMILDISLPSRIDKSAEREGGIKLLEAILENDERYKLPTHIIAITAYVDIKEEFEEKFSQRSISILKYHTVYDDWVRPSLVDYDSFLCVVCALDPELNSVLDIDWSWELQLKKLDDSIYYRGETNNKSTKRIIYAAAASRMGMTASAILAMKMIQKFRPKYLAMTGIAAGTPGKTKFGDVIVADPSWDYGSGKIVNNDNKLVFHPSPHQISLTPNLRTKFKLLKKNREALAKIKYFWKGEKPDNELSILIGPLASGASVVADGLTINKVRLQHKELLGIEMESYSIFAVAEEAIEPRPQAFSIKSVVDFADGNKDDRFQRYGAYTSAQVLRLFVENYL